MQLGMRCRGFDVGQWAPAGYDANSRATTTAMQMPTNDNPADDRPCGHAFVPA
jgi:hypothetical protein